VPSIPFPFYSSRHTPPPPPASAPLSALTQDSQHNTTQLCINTNVHYTTSAMQHPLTEPSIKKKRLNTCQNDITKNVKSSLHCEWPAFTLRQLYLCCLPNVQAERMPQNQYGNPNPATPYYQLPQRLPLLLRLLNCLTKQQ